MATKKTTYESPTPASDKKKALQTALAQIDKNFGKGAVFWMWCSALLGMCTKFSEVTLAVHFRERNANGELVGGPMYYIKNGLAKHWRWLAAIYALFGVLTVFGTGNATQVNTIVAAIDTALLEYNVVA